MKQSKPTFNMKVRDVVNTPCWKVEVTNYGEKQTSFTFFTRSETYAEFKKQGILNSSPDAIVTITKGLIEFVEREF